MSDDEEQSRQPVVRPLSRAKQEKFAAEAERHGVCYLSRIPPYMQPQKLRHLLSAYGEVGRIFLTPEDAATARRRQKLAKKSRQNFTEGWVEFADKAVAKAVARTLNNTPLGGKKSGFYHDDMWNIKYLKGFKWTHLTEQIAYEKATREQRIRNDMMQSKQEDEFYLDKVRQGQGIEAMEKKKLKRAQEADEADEAVSSFLAPRRPLDDADSAPATKKARKAAPVVAPTAPADDKVLRTFRQKMSVTADQGERQLDDSILSKVFGKR